MLTQGIVDEMRCLISQEEDCEFDNSLPQEELINIKRANLPEKEKKIIIDYFTKPFEPIRKKTLSPDHISLIGKALPEIDTIYNNIKKLIHGDKREQKPKLKAKALNVFDRDTGAFKLLKREFLEDLEIYSKLWAHQKIKHFFGELLNKVFKDNGLPTINKDIIYKELTKTTYWKEFRKLKKQKQ